MAGGHCPPYIKIRSKKQRPLINGDDLGDLGDMFTQIAFDAMMQGHGAAGAAVTGAVEADADGAVFFDIDKFDISAVGLNRRTDEIEHFLDPLADRLRCLSRSRHTGTSKTVRSIGNCDPHMNRHDRLL